MEEAENQPKQRHRSWSSISTMTADEAQDYFAMCNDIDIDCQPVGDESAATETYCESDEGYEL